MKLLLKIQANLQLRTKFLLSLVLVIAGLTCATLLVVRRTAQVQAQRQVEEGARNAILTFRIVQHQRQMALRRTADLLATLAFMRNGDATTIQDVEDQWQSDDHDLFVLVNRSGKIVAVRPTIPGFRAAAAEEMLRRSLREGKDAGWWLSGTRLYQVALQPFYDDAPRSTLLGTVVVGREIDAAAASDLRRLSSSDVIFRYGGDIVVSTFSPLKEQGLVEQIQDGPTPVQIQIDNEQFLASSVELTPGVRPAVTLTVLKSYSEAMASLGRLNHLLLGLGLVAVLAGAALAFVISDAFTRPLGSLVEGVRALEQGNFTYPLEKNGGDEVAEVTRAFDHMRSTLQRNEAQRQQLEDQLRQAQKMEALGRLAGGVAHDFNNLLTIIKGHGDLMLERLKPTHPLYVSSQQIRKATDRAVSLTRQLLAFGHRQARQPRILDLNALIAEMARLLKRLIREDIEFVLRPSESLGQVRADQGQIEQVLLNLTVNACDAMPQGGKLTIETYNLAVDQEYARTHPPIEPGHYVVLAVTDTGHGMDTNTKAHIFEPFFTTKERGKGTGLGLSIVYGVVKQSDGFIWVETAQGNGARFEIYLPRVRGHAEPAASEKITRKPGRGYETVLIAEDEGEVRALASEFLTSAGYTVLTAQDGVEALEVAERLGEEIHLLLTDVVMPRMRGPELARRLKRLLPDLKILYMSGYLQANESNGEFLEGALFLHKPFSRELLVRQVRDALKGAPSARAVAQTARS